MKKNSSFFVTMEPPKKRHPDRIHQNRKQPAPSSLETQLQEMNWQKLLVDDLLSDNKTETEIVFSKKILSTQESSDNQLHSLSEQSETDSSSIKAEVPLKQSRRFQFSPKLQRVFLIIRLAAASLMFAAAVLMDTLSPAAALLFFVCMVLAGSDVFFHAIRSILFRNLNHSSVVFSFVAIVSYGIGFRMEAAALMILVPTGKLLVTEMKERSHSSAYKLVDRREADLRMLTEHIFAAPDSDYIYTEAIMDRTTEPLLLAGIVVAVVFAIAVPIISYFRPIVIIHRSLTVILMCTPVSILTALSCIGRNALYAAASHGVVFHDACSLEKMRDVKTFVFDRTGSFCGPEPKIISIHSEALDEQTFRIFVSHLVSESSQSFAKIILNDLRTNPDETLISAFDEEPGGVTATISNCESIFGKRSFVESRGYTVPADVEPEEGIAYYLFVSGRYGGSMVLSSDMSDEISDMLHDLRTNGINKCILLTEQSSEEISEYAEKNGFDVVYAGVQPDDKQSLIRDICSSDRTRKLILTADPNLGSNQQDTVVFTGRELFESDAVVFPHMLSGISCAMRISARINLISYENAILSFLVKAVVIFLSLIGYCNLWMAISADIIATLITILNSERVESRNDLIGGKE